MSEENEFYEENQINFKYYLFRFLNHWHLFVIGVALAVGVAWYLNHSTPPRYKVHSSLLIRQEKGALDLKSIIPEGVAGESTMENQRIQNEIGILRSFRLTKKNPSTS